MPTHIRPPALSPADVPVCVRAEDGMRKRRRPETLQHRSVLSDFRETQSFEKPFSSAWRVSCLISKMKATYEFNRRWVHACEHLEQDCDVGRIQGSFGQHSPKGLTSPGVGGSGAQG